MSVCTTRTCGPNLCMPSNVILVVIYQYTVFGRHSCMPSNVKRGYVRLCPAALCLPFVCHLRVHEPRMWPANVQRNKSPNPQVHQTVEKSTNSEEEICQHIYRKTFFFFLNASGNYNNHNYILALKIKGLRRRDRKYIQL